MKIKWRLLSFTLILMTLVSGCSWGVPSVETTKNTVPSDDHLPQQYLGRNLEIGFLGTPPNITDSKLAFTSIDIEDFAIETVEQFDAVFIMQEYLEEAADGPFTDVFSDADVLFFLVETEAYHFPFTEENISYKDYSKRIHDDEIFALGYYPNPDKKAEEGISTWYFNILRKDLSEEENEEIQKGLYYQMFNIARDYQL